MIEFKNPRPLFTTKRVGYGLPADEFHYGTTRKYSDCSERWRSETIGFWPRSAKSGKKKAKSTQKPR
jgi:hypothetical protein